MEPAAKKPVGRPRKNLAEVDFREGALHAFLAPRLRDHSEKGVLNVRMLSDATGNCRYTVYRWLHNSKLPPRAAQSIVRVSGGRITLDMLAPFVFR